MQTAFKPRSGYASHPITKAPNWHGLVAWDLLLNNLTTGLFLVAALGELARPAAFGPLGKVAYPLALALLLADLACLVFDLGNPLKFHHMLRVFKPSSPMSLGTWCLTAYSLPLSALAVGDLAAAIGRIPAGSDAWRWIRTLCLIAGLVPALGSAAYKGVLFSTSAQPGWKDARWFGAYLVHSALMLGAAELLAIAQLMGRPEAAIPLRPAVVLLMATNALPLGLLLRELRTGLAPTRTRAGRVGLGALAFGLGLAIPLGLSLAMPGVLGSVAALAALGAGGFAVRWAIVMIPHRTH